MGIQYWKCFDFEVSIYGIFLYKSISIMNNLLLFVRTTNMLQIECDNLWIQYDTVEYLDIILYIWNYRINSTSIGINLWNEMINIS